MADTLEDDGADRRAVAMTTAGPGRLRRLAAAFAGCVLFACLLGAPANAHPGGRLSWAKPVSVDPTGGPNKHGGYLAAVTCPTPTQCTAVDGQGSGDQATFDPLAPRTPTPTMIDDTNLADVACPSTTQCTAVDFGSTADGGANAVTFNPRSRATPSKATIAGASLSGVACPTLTQCTAVDHLGNEVTFNPQLRGTPASTTVDTGGAVAGLACPTATQCTVIDATTGARVTFDPQSPGTPAPTTIDSVRLDRGLACSSATQCTATDVNGAAVTFDPQSSAAPMRNEIDARRTLNAIACPSVNECVAVTSDGRAMQGDPTSSSPWTVEPVAHGDLLAAVSCPSTVECVGVDFKGEEMTGTVTSAGSGGGAGVSLIRHVRVLGAMASVTMKCAGSATKSCRDKLTLRVVETVRGGKVIAIAAQASPTSKGQGTRRERTVVLASRSLTLAGGSNRTVQLSLSDTGRRLLAAYHRLHVELLVARTSGQTSRTVAMRTVTFRTKPRTR
jgi:hypothetical protein